MKPRLIIALLLLVVLVTGCWSRRELNDLAIVLGIGIDKVGEQYLISTQIVAPGQVSQKNGGGSEGAPVTTYTIRSNTIMEGIRRLTTITPRRLYFSHIRVLVIGEQIAREGVRDILDFFFRDPEVRPDFYFIVAKNTLAVNVMSIFTPVEKIPSNKLHKSLETSEKAWAPTISVNLDEFIGDLISDGKEPVLTGLEIKGDVGRGETDDNVKKIRPYTHLRYSSIGVFKDDKLVGWLDESESKGYNYIVNNVANTVGHVPCEKGGNVVIELVRAKTNLKGKVRNGKPEIEVEVWAEANVGEVACSVDLSKAESVYGLEINTEKRIRELVAMTVKTAQTKFKSDIFGFGAAIHRADPQSWEKLKQNWEQEFVKIKVTTKADVRIRRTGKVGKSFIDEMKKK